MKLRSVNFKILLSIALAFFITTISLIGLVDYQLTKMIDSSQVDSQEINDVDCSEHYPKSWIEDPSLEKYPAFTTNLPIKIDQS